IDFLNELLFSYEFHRVDFVSEPGEFSIRGGIVDVFSYSDERPYRISLFGDEVESIRAFDIETQLSVEKIKEFTIVPNLENKFSTENRESFLQYISDKTIVVAKNIAVIKYNLHRNFKLEQDIFEDLKGELERATPNELFLDSTEFVKDLEKFPVVEFSLNPYFESDTIQMNQSPQPSFNKQFDLLLDEFKQKIAEGYTNYLFCSGEKQVQ